jgi:hypothetical protein
MATTVLNQIHITGRSRERPDHPQPALSANTSPFCCCTPCADFALLVWLSAVMTPSGRRGIRSLLILIPLNPGRPAEGGGEVGIHLEGGQGSPTEVQVSQCWAFYVNKALYVTVRAPPEP